MPVARIGDLDLCYEEIGDKDGEPLLMVQGFGAQMIHWPRPLCELAASKGFRVIRYDNRDVGESTRLEHLGGMSSGRAMTRFLLGLPVPAPYSLEDMADDGIGLLDHLGIERAHVWGVSMGGLIAQRMAIHHPRRLKSATLMMTWTGSRFDGVPHPRAVLALLEAPAKTAEENGRLTVRMHRALAGSLPNDEEALYELGVRVFERAAGRPVGYGRHLLAVLAGGSQQRALGRVRTPTTVLHGAEDPLIPPSGGRSLAKHIQGATLHVYPGMGHQMPRALWTAYVDKVLTVAHRGGFENAPL